MPWKNQLHEVAIYAVDFMLNDLIYAELLQLDYTEFAYYILRQSWRGFEVQQRRKATRKRSRSIA